VVDTYIYAYIVMELEMELTASRTMRCRRDVRT